MLNLNWQYYTYVQKRWYHSANHSLKWDGIIQDHLSNATTPLQLDFPTKPSSPQNKFNGHAVPLAPMQRCSRPVQILLGTCPQKYWQLQHQEPFPNIPPLKTEDLTDFPLLPSAHCILVLFLFFLTMLTARMCRSTGIPPVSTVPVNIIYSRSVLRTG